MKSLDEIADFIAAREYLSDVQWQIFDISAAKELTDEMFRQYSAGEHWNMNTPPPAQNCVFWDGESTIFTHFDGEKITALIGEEFELARVRGELDAKRKMVSDLMAERPDYASLIKKAFGEDEGSRIIDIAQSPANEYAPKIATCAIGAAPEDVTTKCVAVWSEFVAFPIAQCEPKQIERPTRRRLQRMGVQVEVRTVSLSQAKHKAQDAAHSPGDTRALHFCRGHWRKNNRSPSRRMVDGAWRIWIAGHWKGDPDKGVILHNYVCNMRDLDLRSKLIA